MHQDPADNVLFLRPTLEALVQNAQRLSRLALIGELCCVVQDQDRAIGRSRAVAGGPEMPCENWLLTNSPVGKKAVSRLGVGPILAGQRN